MPGYAPREMSLDEYQAAALRTARSDHATLIERFLVEAFGGAELVPVVVREVVARAVTVDEEREKEWSRRNPFKPRPVVERRLPVVMVAPPKPPECQACGWPLAARPAAGDPFCSRCEHRSFHARGCGCPWDVAGSRR